MFKYARFGIYFHILKIFMTFAYEEKYKNL